MKSRVIVSLLLVSLMLISSVASAQQLVKGMRCVDGFLGVPIDHENLSGSTRTMTVQIVKDRCRPTGDSGFFALLVTGPGADVLYFGERYRGFTKSVTFSLQNGAVATVGFSGIGGSRVSGTFDYTYKID